MTDEKARLPGMSAEETRPTCAGGLPYRYHRWDGDGDEIACHRCGLRIEGFLPITVRSNQSPAEEETSDD